MGSFKGLFEVRFEVPLHLNSKLQRRVKEQTDSKLIIYKGNDVEGDRTT